MTRSIMQVSGTETVVIDQNESDTSPITNRCVFHRIDGILEWCESGYSLCVSPRSVTVIFVFLSDVVPMAPDWIVT